MNQLSKNGESGRRQLLLALALISTLGFAIYSHTLSYSFIFDDVTFILRNPFIQKAEESGKILSIFKTRFLTVLSLGWNFLYDGFNPYWYRFLNLVIHISNSILVGILAVYLFQTPRLRDLSIFKYRYHFGFLSSLLFLCHPLQIQPVVLVWQRHSSLCALFYLAAIILYLIGRRRGSLITLSGAFLATVAAMYTKENSVTLPVLILFLEVVLFSKVSTNGFRRSLVLLPFLLTVAIIPVTQFALKKPSKRAIVNQKLETKKDQLRYRGEYVVKWVTKGFVHTDNLDRLTGKEHYLTQINVLTTYLRMIFYPTGLNVDYDYPVSKSLFEPRTIFSLITLLLIFIFSFGLYRRGEFFLFFAVVWFFVTISVETIIPINDVIFNYRLYLPIVGFTIFVPILAYYLIRRIEWVVICVVIFTIILSLLTFQRTHIWQDTISLWTDVVSKSPKKARPLTSLCSALYRNGERALALPYCEEAIKVSPNSWKAHNNLALIFSSQGEFEKAIYHYKKAIQIGSKFPNAYNNLGLIYEKQGKTELAKEHYKRAISVRPSFLEAGINLGSLYAKEKKYEEAEKRFRRVIRLNSRSVEGYYNLALVLSETNRLSEALDYLTRVIELDPYHAKAYNLIGVILASFGKKDVASSFFEEALRVDSNLKEAAVNLKKITKI